MARNVSAVDRGLCGHVLACSNGNDYCILKPHSDAIGHVSKVNTPHDCAGRAVPYEDCPMPWVHVGYTPAENVLKGLEYIQDQYGDAHVCPPVLVVNEEFYRTILELITSGGESMRRQYADAVILIAERIKEQERIPGTTAWIGDGT